MLIREATKKDLQEIQELLGGMDNESALEPEEAADIWNRINQYPYYKVFVAEDEFHGNKVVGTFCLIILDNLGHRGAKLAVVENVIVSHKLRGQGVGHQMMAYAMEMAKEENCYKIMLSSNKKRILAHKFYKKIGFKQHGISFAVEVQ